MDGANWFAASQPSPPDRELVIDSFAGGGGASTGIEAALGRSPDYAINHDAQALALHAANHPATVHLSKNIWQVDPLEVVGRRPVGLAWFSPDCKHFSKAKGGRPVSRGVRDLAWVVVLWARRVRPRVIMLENVEEFRTWGPLTAEGKPCAERRGQTFDAWCAELRRLGYRVEHREMRACDYGAPTIRKRLFVIARRDGRPIVWPAPTHGAPDSEGVAAGRLRPWRTAAEIIDWDLPCPSIFDTAEEIMAKHGLRAVRPLAENTLRRIARGVMRYVIESPRPFVMMMRNSAKPWTGIEEPMHTVTAGGAFPHLVVPELAAATLVQTGYGEREGQAPRALDIGAPIGTQVAGGAKHALVAAFLAQHNTGMVGHAATEPVSTLTGKGCNQQLVAAWLAKHQTGSTGAPLDAPAPTITANSYRVRPGGAAPIALAAASMITLRGSDRRDAGVDEPLRTLSAGGTHAGLIAAFLTKYYGQGEGAGIDGPLHTDTTRDRFGLVTVEIAGAAYAIADIGMRMLTPRERFRAQGFPDDYRIDVGRGPDGEDVPLTLDAQGRMCGNSVCPPLARALVAANCADMALAAEAAA